MSINSVMPSNHLILCHPLFLLPPISPSIRVFSNESTLRMRWPKYWSFSFSISPSKERPELISFGMDWLDLLAAQGDSQESSPMSEAAANPKVECLAYRTPEKARTACAHALLVRLRTQHRKEGSSRPGTRRHDPNSTQLRGRGKQAPRPGALKYHSARFTESNNGSFE